MSKSAKRVVKNSFFQTFGAFGITALNLFLMLGYARIFGPEGFGSLVTAQAQVLVWGWLVDLGLSQSLISALTRAEGTKSERVRQTFRARDLLFRVLLVRITGAVIGAVGIITVAWLQPELTQEELLTRLAFVPFLFATALMQTANAFATFRHQQAFAVCTQAIGVAVTVALPLWLAARGVAIHWVVLSQSWGGFLSGSTIFIYFYLERLARRRAGKTRRAASRLIGPWGREAWVALALDAWPFAAVFCVNVLWQRLDQIVVSSLLGYEQGGQYALAVRLTAVPILVATSISFALFPDLQRIGRDSPARLRVILGATSKAVYRYGVLVVAALLISLALVLPALVPKFRVALKLLPYFVPGVWAFWLQSSVVSALFGLRHHKAAVLAHAGALLVYVPAVLLLPRWLGLGGVVWAFNIFCLCLCAFALYAAKHTGLFPAGYAPFAAFTPDEAALWRRFGWRSLFGAAGSRGA